MRTALLTANLTMVELPDWKRMMAELVPDRPPALCQNDAIIDWIVNQPKAHRNAEQMLRSMLSILPEGQAAEARVRGWVTALKSSFPDMVEATNAYLQSLTGASLRELHLQALEEHEAPVTQQIMNAPAT